MGRGKHQITKDKKEIKQLTKIAVATERAKKALDRKDFNKDWAVWLRNHLGKMLENIDPLELTAILGITVLVKGVIDKSEEIRSKIHPFVTFGEIPEGYKAVFSGIPFWYDLVKEGEKYEGLLPDSMDWLVAFAVAFVIMRHGSTLIGAGGSIINVIIGLFT